MPGTYDGIEHSRRMWSSMSCSACTKDQHKHFTYDSMINNHFWAYTWKQFGSQLLSKTFLLNQYVIPVQSTAKGRRIWKHRGQGPAQNGWRHVDQKKGSKWWWQRTRKMFGIHCLVKRRGEQCIGLIHWQLLYQQIGQQRRSTSRKAMLFMLF